MSTVATNDIVNLFMLSYHSAREDRMTRYEARLAARQFIAGSTLGTDAALAAIDSIDDRMLP
jgi:hypothetical protein